MHGATAAAYAGLALHFWNTRWRAQARPAAGLQSWERAAIVLPLALHGWTLADALFLSSPLRFGFAPALSVMLWLGVLVYWIENLLYRLDGVEPLVLGAAALAAPLPAIFPGLVLSDARTHSIEFRLHLVLAMIAYSLFVIAVLHATLMALVERRLHHVPHAAAGDEGVGPLGGPLSRLPPLLTLERLLFRIVALAFAFLTLTLLTGLVFSESVFGRALRFDHKTLFALLSWAAFGALLIGRHFYGWRGRTALRWTLGGFVLLLLAYVGSRFVLEVILGRG
ncbi:MAG: cytochrome c biogenesis protein CcsA [Burkholderiales bacterium]|nr:cytochrome c biogenesis protein CcsA [Burkholderiales bacterium]